MTIRRATEADLKPISELWLAFEQEVPPSAHVDIDHERELAEIAEIVRHQHAFVAEDERGPVGFALARRTSVRVGRLTDLYVVPDARGAGVARALVQQVVAAFVGDGLERLALEVQAANGPARAVYARWGLAEELLVLGAPLAELAARLERAGGRSFGSIHVQTDDQAAVERAVRQFVPRLPGRSQGSLVSAARNGWVSVYDEACDREPADLVRLARELAERLGGVVLRIGVEAGAVVRYALHDGGRLVDEYLSVPEHFGSLPPGDVIALQANPTVVARLTGASPARIRAVARTAVSAAELPPATELVDAIAAAMGIEGAGHGYSDAPELPGGVRLDR